MTATEKHIYKLMKLAEPIAKKELKSNMVLTHFFGHVPWSNNLFLDM